MGPIRKYRKKIHDDLSNRGTPSLHMACATCKSEQTFFLQVAWERIEKPYSVEIWRYLCAGCRTAGRVFFLTTGKDKTGDYIRKIGQKPDWEATLDPRLSKMLGTNASMFKRGLDSESSGYGIGAFAYYRRVVEDMIGDLLERIRPLLTEAEQVAYSAALEEVRKTTVAQDKIELVKDLLPVRLQPSGINPLSVLHTELSVGLHGKSDQDCLDDAEAIRSALSYLVVELGRAEEAGSQFTDGMRKILSKRASKKAEGPAPGA